MPNGNINSDALDSLFDPKGNVVLEQFEDSAYGTTAVLLRPESAAYRAQTGLGDPYVVAYGYDKETGEWSHGYYTSNLSYALDRANPEILEKATIKWQREDFEAALEEKGDVLIAVLCAVDNDSLPLLTAIKPDGKGIYHLQTIETNFILSVYGKNEFELYFKQRITPEKIVYYNEKQGQKLERLVGIQFPDYYSSIAPNTIIKLPCCINNPKTPVQNGLSVHLESTADKKENWNITDELDKLGKLDKQATVEHAEELPFDIGDSGDDNR